MIATKILGPFKMASLFMNRGRGLTESNFYLQDKKYLHFIVRRMTEGLQSDVILDSPFKCAWNYFCSQLKFVCLFVFWRENSK